MTADFGANKPDVDTPRDYFVPNFGLSHEVLYTQ